MSPGLPNDEVHQINIEGRNIVFHAIGRLLLGVSEVGEAAVMILNYQYEQSPTLLWCCMRRH